MLVQPAAKPPSLPGAVWKKKEERGGATPSKLFCRAKARQPARPILRQSARGTRARCAAMERVAGITIYS